MSEQGSIVVLNEDPNLDLCSSIYSNFFQDFKEEYNLSCLYYTESSSIAELKQKNPNDLIVMSVNCQSYLSKKSEFITILDNYKCIYY